MVASYAGSDSSRSSRPLSSYELSRSGRPQNSRPSSTSTASRLSRNIHHDSDSDSDNTLRPSDSGSVVSNTSTSHHLPRVIEAYPSDDEHSSEGEAWVLAQWDRERPTSTFGTQYGQHSRPRSHPHPHPEARSQSTGSSARSGTSSRRSTRTAGTSSSSSSSSARRSHASRHTSRSDDLESVEDRLSRFSIGLRDGHEEDSEDELRLPSNYGRSAGGSVAGSAVSRRSRSSRASGY